MVSIHEAQAQLRELIEAVSRSHQPIVIAGESGNAVLLSESDWVGIQETLYLLSVPGMRESIREDLQLRSRNAISLANSVGHEYTKKAGDRITLALLKAKRSPKSSLVRAQC